MDIPGGIRKRTENIHLPTSAHPKLSVQALRVLAAKPTRWELRWVLCVGQRGLAESSTMAAGSPLQRYEEVGFPGAVSFPPCGNAPLEMRLVSVAVCICT